MIILWASAVLEANDYAHSGSERWQGSWSIWNKSKIWSAALLCRVNNNCCFVHGKPAHRQQWASVSFCTQSICRPVGKWQTSHHWMVIGNYIMSCISGAYEPHIHLKCIINCSSNTQLLLHGHVEYKRYLLQCCKVLNHPQISQCSDSLVPNFSPLKLIPFKTICQSSEI